MRNQHTPTSSISPGAAFLLAVAVLSGTTLAGLVVAQAIVPTIHVYLGSGPLLAAITTLSGGGFLTHIAVSRVMRRLNELSAQRVVYLPPSSKVSEARHLRVVGDTAHGIGPEAIAAARALAKRIVDGPFETVRDVE